MIQRRIVMSASTSQHHLELKQFQDAILRYIDEAKPDPLAKNQMMNLRLEWIPDADNDGAADVCHEGRGTKTKQLMDNTSESCGIFGKLSLSSEYIPIVIHVKCQWRIQQDYSTNNKSDCCTTTTDQSSAPPASTHTPQEQSTILQEWDDNFQNIFYFRLGVEASCISLNEYNKTAKNAQTTANKGSSTLNDDDSNFQKMDRKDRSVNRKLRSGMIKRLSADPFILKLLPDKEKESTNIPADGILLCEVLIQQNNYNTRNNTFNNIKCEERVNVNSESIEGVRNAILSHWEDNLDVLEMLLNMPYLPRCRVSDSENKDQEDVLNSLSGRAFLRLLEDAMFDACEKEGEDEMLDDLNISDGKDGGTPGEDQEMHCRVKKKKIT